MKHEAYSDHLVLFLYGELQASEVSKLKDHLSVCSECQKRLAELQELHEVLRQQKYEVPEQILRQARDQLFGEIRRKDRQTPPASNRIGFLKRLFGESQLDWSWATAGGTIAGLSLGLMLGYFAFSSGNIGSNFSDDLDPFNPSGMKIGNVTLENRDANSREVRLSFEAARRFELEGSFDDPRIQRFLAYALINEQNAGTRLRAVSTIREQAPTQTDREIRNALILALRQDENPAVRQQALNALQQYPLDGEIKQTLLHVLAEDPNAKLRIEAINALDKVYSEGQTLELEVLEVLEDKLQNDSNKYIRLRAKAVLEDVQPLYF